MPVTARLSRRFYETFGDDLANELVNWFNDVDAIYRSDLRELNDLNSPDSAPRSRAGSLGSTASSRRWKPGWISG